MMEKGLTVFTIFFVLISCGGKAVIDRESSWQGTGDATSTDSGTAGAGGSTSSSGQGGECEPQLTVTTVWHNVITVAPGDKDVLVVKVEFSASACHDISLDTIDFELHSPDAGAMDNYPYCGHGCDPICTSDCEPVVDWNFRNFRLNDASGGQTLMGPTELHWYSPAIQAVVSFTDPLIIQAGTTREVAFYMDIAQPTVTPISGMRYHASPIMAQASSWSDVTIDYQPLEDEDAYITVMDSDSAGATLLVSPPTTPSSTIVQDAKLVTMGYFYFTASGGPIYIHSLRFKDVGTSDWHDITAVRIQGDALPLSISPVQNFDPFERDVIFDVDLLLLDGELTAVGLVLDFDALTPGGTHAIEIQYAEDVVVMDGQVSGDFPEFSGTFTVVP